MWYTYTSGVQTGKRFLHADHLGSIVAMTNGNSAPSIDRYDEYGIPGTTSTGTVTNVGRFQYTGQIYIPELGMYDYKARIYSPRLGRFLQTDPVGYQGGINIYEYAEDDPVDHSDPTGLMDCAGTSLCPDVLQGAIQHLQKSLNELGRLQKDLANGTRLSKQEIRTQNRVIQFLGKQAGSTSAGVGSVIAAGSKIMGVLTDNSKITSGPDRTNTNAYASTRGTANGPFLTTLHPHFFASSTSDAMRQETLVHEAAHRALGAVDITNRVSDEARWANVNPSEAWRNADNFPLAFGFNRDDQ